MGSNVYITRDILRFTSALAVGGKLQLFSLTRKSALPVEIPVLAQPKIRANRIY